MTIYKYVQLDNMLSLFPVSQLFIIVFEYLESMFLVSKNNEFVKGSITDIGVQGGSTLY